MYSNLRNIRKMTSHYNRLLEGISILVNRLGANNPAGIVLHSNIGINMLPMGIWSCSGGEHVYSLAPHRLSLLLLLRVCVR
jgi:hypothetical protein